MPLVPSAIKILHPKKQLCCVVFFRTITFCNKMVQDCWNQWWMHSWLGFGFHWPTMDKVLWRNFKQVFLIHNLSSLFYTQAGNAMEMIPMQCKLTFGLTLYCKIYRTELLYKDYFPPQQSPLSGININWIHTSLMVKIPQNVDIIMIWKKYNVFRACKQSEPAISMQ